MPSRSISNQLCFIPGPVSSAGQWLHGGLPGKHLRLRNTVLRAPRGVNFIRYAWNATCCLHKVIKSPCCNQLLLLLIAANGIKLSMRRLLTSLILRLCMLLMPTIKAKCYTLCVAQHKQHILLQFLTFIKTTAIPIR